MKFEFDCTAGKETDKLRAAINAPEFGKRLIGRLDSEAIPGIAQMTPAERARGHVHLLDREATGNLAFQARLSGITWVGIYNLNEAAAIIEWIVRETIVDHLQAGVKMDLFVVVIPNGSPIQRLSKNIEGRFELASPRTELEREMCANDVHDVRPMIAPLSPSLLPSPLDGE